MEVSVSDKSAHLDTSQRHILLTLQVRGPVPAEASRIYRLQQHCLPLPHGSQQVAGSPHGKCHPTLGPGQGSGRNVGLEQGEHR